MTRGMLPPIGDSLHLEPEIILGEKFREYTLPHIPDEFTEEWLELSAELNSATIELDNAQKRHQSLVLARIALREKIRSIYK